jgi:hypothetical protein
MIYPMFHVLVLLNLLMSSNHNSLDHDCVGPAQSLNALFDSPNI